MIVMSSQPTPGVYTISTNLWKVPSVERAFDGWLEGAPTEEQRRESERSVMEERSNWKPGDQAWQMLEDLKAFIGHRVIIQFWDPIMFMLDEGPSPLEVDCLDVVTLPCGEFTQAYLVLDCARERPGPDTYSPLCFLIERPDSGHRLAPVSELYQIWLAETE